METKVYSIKGKESGSLKLPEGLFGLRWNSNLVHQVSTSLASNIRKAIAHTKTRGEVRGGGKKPWQQKGTGRARHGSTRSPIWRHGGITHGPRNDKNFLRTVPKGMKTKALYTILSRKFKDGEILFVDSFKFTEPKTKIAKSTFSDLARITGFKDIMSKKKNSAIIALAHKDANVERAVKNLANFEVMEVRNLHPLALLKYKYVVIDNPEEALKVLPGQK